jgi:hypothetical protein
MSFNFCKYFHPQVDDSSVSGTDAAVNVLSLQDGGVSFEPLLGDMLRVHRDTPQVRKKHTC